MQNHSTIIFFIDSGIQNGPNRKDRNKYSTELEYFFTIPLVFCTAIEEYVRRVTSKLVG